MFSVVFVAAFAAVMVGVGWNAVFHLDRDGRLLAGERVIASFAIGCLVVYFAVFAVASFRFDALTMWGALLALALVSLPGFARTTIEPRSAVVNDTGRSVRRR